MLTRDQIEGWDNAPPEWSVGPSGFEVRHEGRSVLLPPKDFGEIVLALVRQMQITR